MKMKRKMKRRTKRRTVVFVCACEVAALALGLFLVSVPLANSASTAGVALGLFSALAFCYGIAAAVQTAARKYKEASE